MLLLLVINFIPLICRFIAIYCHAKSALFVSVVLSGKPVIDSEFISNHIMVLAK